MLKMFKYITIILFTVIIIITACFLGGVYHLNRYAGMPFNDRSIPQKITIGSGQGVSTVAERLHYAKIISHPLKFKIYARLNKLDTSLKAGEYLLSGAMSPTEILEKLVKGSVVLYRLTIPEGHTVVQIADLVEKSGIIPGALFLKATHNTNMLKSLGIDGQTFEGYVFPDTYFFPKNTLPEKLLTTMVGRFWEVFTPAWQKRAADLGWSLHDVVIFASIIEKETGDPAERPVISSVFHNRLKLRMRLESDPTVIYGIKNFDGNVTRKHLRTSTPYNTYTIKGLPAGPIANPGAKAIEAALYPAETQYLFFVSKKNRTHHFSRTIQEHNRAVRKYQLRRR
jgi:peptidoglycan lytic transglycosylase G